MTAPAPQKHNILEPRTRGACPRLAEPMETGDGLLARILPSAPIPIDAFAALCAAAQTHGNGLMEVTARGSLQVRGLSETSSQEFATAASALDFPFDERLPVIASPLPSAPEAAFDAHALAEDIRTTVAARGLALAPKVSVIVDDGGPVSLDGLRADIRLRLLRTKPQPRLHVAVGGDAATAAPLGVIQLDIAAALTADLLAVLSAQGPRARAHQIVEEAGPDAFLAAAKSRVMPAAHEIQLRAVETIGLHRLHDGTCAIGVALPFGQARALDLIALARIAGANGAAWIATAPQRTLLIGPVGEMTAFALGTAADTLGFVVDARDARRRIAACAGAPACASAYLPARALAAEIAGQIPQGGFALHISGCSKGCAHPRPAPLTLVGHAHGARFIDSEGRIVQTDCPAGAGGAVAEAVRRIAAENQNA